jgi:capsular exopolysaccharide synthesis family protein
MEIRQILLLIRKWLWLAILGAVLGGAATYIFSSRQPEIYQASSRVMVSAVPDETGVSTYYINNDLKRTTTYAQLIAAKPVLEETGEKLGFELNKELISVRQLPDSLLLEVIVNDSDPERAALIANSLIEVFIEYNEALQERRFESSELSLQTQISTVEEQIAAIESELSKIDEQTEETLLAATEQRLEELKEQMDAADDEIIKLEQQLIQFIPPQLPTAPVPGDGSAATATPAPTPTIAPERYAEYLDIRQQLDQWTTLRNLYKETYVGLLVSGNDTSDAADINDARQNQLQATLALYQQIYTNLLNNYEAIRLARLRSTPNVVQIEPASIPEEPIQPQPLRDMLLGAVSGALLMGVIAFVIEFLDDSLKTPEDIQNHLGVPVIGFIGEMDQNNNVRTGVYVAENPLSPITDSFRTLRTNLEFASVDKAIKTLLITSTQPYEGKTTLAVNLSVIMSQGGKGVILVDTDLRQPSIHRYLNIANRVGLSNAFVKQLNVSEIITQWGNPKISVITSGSLPPNPTELISSAKMDQILGELREKADIVILDAPPGIVADPIVLASKVDGVVVVIEPGKTKIDAAEVLMEQLERAGAKVVGAVMNPISRRRAHYYSKYSYYSTNQYYSSESEHDTNENGAKKGETRQQSTEEEQPGISAPSD